MKKMKRKSKQKIEGGLKRDMLSLMGGVKSKNKNVNGRIRTYDPGWDRSLVCCFRPLSHVYNLTLSHIAQGYPINLS